jgi:hypothetical protein
VLAPRGYRQSDRRKYLQIDAGEFEHLRKSRYAAAHCSAWHDGLVRGDTIEQFMWGFQRTFRSVVESTLQRSLEGLGVTIEPTVF